VYQNSDKNEVKMQYQNIEDQVVLQGSELDCNQSQEAGLVEKMREHQMSLILLQRHLKRYYNYQQPHTQISELPLLNPRP